MDGLRPARINLAIEAGPPTSMLLVDTTKGAAAAGEIRAGVDPYELLLAVASLSSLSSQPALDVGPEQARRMVELLIDGLRYQGR